MKLRTMLVMVGATLLLTTGYAVAETAQQTKMKTCNAEATAKNLKGDARNEFMKTCLTAGGDAAAPKPMNPQQERMKTCNADATAKGLKGSDRKAFMKTCLSAK